MKKIRLLEVLDCFYPNVDGPIEVMNNIARGFEKTGAEVELLVPNYPKNVEVEGLKIHRCKSVATRGGYRAALPFLDPSVKKLIKHGNFDIIHLHSPFTLPRYVLKLGKKYGVPVVITVHTKFRYAVYNLVKGRLLRKAVMNYILKCIDGCDGITSVSKGMVDELKDYGSKRVDDVKVIYNATDMSRCTADPGKVQALHKKHGLDGKVAFIYAGRLVEAKNVQFTLNVLKKVKERGQDNFKFLIIGDGLYEKTLKNLTATLGLEENVEFVGRITDKKLLADYYGACDLLLFPSVFDNGSIVLLESTACGLPGATVAGSCSAERIEDGINGFAWEYSEDAWAEKLCDILKDGSALDKVKSGARDMRGLEWDEIVQEYAEFYETLLK